MSVKVNELNSTPVKNFGLHESEFLQMCSQLKHGDESIFEKIYLNHFKDCQKFLKSKLHTSNDESHDATMQTLLNFRRSLILGRVKYGNLNFLFTQMAYYEVLKKRNQKNFHYDKNLEYLRSASIDLSEDEVESHLDLTMILKSLPKNQRHLIVSHYYNNMKLSEIASQEGVPSSTLRKRKERILKIIKRKLLAKTKFKK